MAAEKSSAKRIDTNTIETTFKRDGKIVATIHRKVAAEGRVLTATVRGVLAKGEKFEQVIVYDKQ